MPTVTGDNGPAALDLVVHQGGRFAKTFLWEDGGGDPVDLTGYSAALEAGPVDGGAAVLSLSSGSGVTLGGAAGTIAVVVEGDDTAGLPLGRFGYDLVLTSAGGRRTALLAGHLDVRRGYAGVN